MTSLPSPIAVVGLGYVGLPLAAAFGRHTETLAFDVSAERIAELQKGHDRNRDLSPSDFDGLRVRFTDDPVLLEDSPFIIIAVPTPIDKSKRPDLRFLEEASRTVGRHLQQGSTVVYESTVYPGCTEEVCIPLLETESGLTAGEDFKVGYSPERINPGDVEHTLRSIVKVVAGQDEETAQVIAEVYEQIVDAGVHRARDIKTAEAAKVIENVQRDLNIALMNELAILFHKMDIDTTAVLEAAGTKWNFLPFRPGMVGGHCIPVDPYYLTYRAEMIGHHPDVILAGRRINDTIGTYVAQATVKLLIRADVTVRGSQVLVLGATFKEDVPDLRNSRVFELIQELESYGVRVDVHEPMIDEQHLRQNNLAPVTNPFAEASVYDAVILAVPHRTFLERPHETYLKLFDEAADPVVVDVKGALFELKKNVNSIHYWQL